MIDHNITPRIGAIRLDTLRPADLDACYANLIANGGRQRQGLSAKTVLEIHRVVSNALDLAVEIAKADAWLSANPANAKSDGDRYLNGWLSRAQERAPRVGGPSLDAAAPTREEIAERLPVTPNRIIRGGLFQ